MIEDRTGVCQVASSHDCLGTARRRAEDTVLGTAAEHRALEQVANVTPQSPAAGTDQPREWSSQHGMNCTGGLSWLMAFPLTLI